jgi:hypothetical protein
MPADQSVLTALQVDTAGSVLKNQGLAANSAFTASVAAFSAVPVIAKLLQTIAAGSGVLTPANQTAITTLGAAVCPALGDTLPAAGASGFTNKTMTTLLTQTAATYMGNGDLSKFCQALAIAVGYAGTTNQFVNSAVNSQKYLGSTFTNMNSTVSGGITTVNICTPQWGADLSNLGRLINLANLDELGTPLALVKQLAAVGGMTPEIALQFSAAGVSLDTVVNLNSPGLTATPADQKAMYAAMTQITGTTLTQALQILGVKTSNITTMADLLNPYKIFPNSFQTLTVLDVNKVSQNIYINSSGAVNPKLPGVLPTVVVNTIV